MRAQDRSEDPGVDSGRLDPNGDELSPSSSPVFSLPDLSPCWEARGAEWGLTNEPELVGVLKALPSSNEEHSSIDARVKAGLHIKSLPIPGSWAEACRAGLMPTAPPAAHCPLACAPLPVIGLLSVPSILKARAEEHVLVDTATHAVQVGRHRALPLYQGQQHS